MFPASPDEQHVVVSLGRVEALALRSSQTEAHGEDGERQSQQARQDEQDGPH